MGRWLIMGVYFSSLKVKNKKRKRKKRKKDHKFSFGLNYNINWRLDNACHTVGNRSHLFFHTSFVIIIASIKWWTDDDNIHSVYKLVTPFRRLYYSGVYNSIKDIILAPRFFYLLPPFTFNKITWINKSKCHPPIDNPLCHIIITFRIIPYR